MVFNTTLKNISVILLPYWWRKPEYLRKTTDLSEVTDKLYQENNTKRVEHVTHTKTGEYSRIKRGLQKEGQVVPCV
jgi:hypothetical protein